jgi:two-component system, sensor histidine kinase LadS
MDDVWTQRVTHCVQIVFQPGRLLAVLKHFDQFDRFRDVVRGHDCVMGMLGRPVQIVKRVFGSPSSVVGSFGSGQRSFDCSVRSIAFGGSNGFGSSKRSFNRDMGGLSRILRGFGLGVRVTGFLVSMGKLSRHSEQMAIFSVSCKISRVRGNSLLRQHMRFFGIAVCSSSTYGNRFAQLMGSLQRQDGINHLVFGRGSVAGFGQFMGIFDHLDGMVEQMVHRIDGSVCRFSEQMGMFARFISVLHQTMRGFGHCCSCSKDCKCTDCTKHHSVRHFIYSLWKISVVFFLDRLTDREWVLPHAHIRNPTQPIVSKAQDAEVTLRRIVIMTAIIQLWMISVSFAQDVASFESFYWVDDRHDASLEEAQRAVFTKFEGSIALGYSKNALWIKLGIAAQSDARKLAIVVEPAFVRRIELYDPAMNGVNAPPALSGRDAAIEVGNHVGLYSGFIIPSSLYDRDVYLRITTTTSLTANISVLAADKAVRNGFVQGGLVAVYIAFLLSFGMWGLMAWAIRRDALFALFALRQLFSSAHIFVYFGTLRFFSSGYLSADARDMIYVFVSCTVASIGGYFDIRLISGFGGSRRLKQTIYIILCVPIIALPLAALGHTQTALKITAMLINVQLLLLVILTFSADGDRSKPFGHLSLWLIRCGYLIMAAVVVVPIMMYLNILGTSVPLFKMLFLHAIISTIILFGLLLVRSRQRDLAEQETRVLLSVKDAALFEESSRRIEKESFLSMLTHELRNPLSVIQLLSSSEKSNDKTLRQAASDMANVIARVEQSERIDGGQIHVEKSYFDFVTLVTQVVRTHSVHERVVIESAAPQMLLSDRQLLQHVFENLLDNAAKYSVKGSEVRVEVSDQAVDGRSGVVVLVSNVIGDAGAPDPDRVFTKYYRAKGAHRKPGSGLGLFLVARWVAALGGSVDFSVFGEVEGPQTATFSVWVPR